MSSVTWTVAALTNISRIATYIEQFNPTAAKLVASELRRASDSLAQLARRARIVVSKPPGTRDLVANDQYIIRHRITGTEGVIFAREAWCSAPDLILNATI